MSTNKVKKKIRAANIIKENENLFKCPVCSNKMHISNSSSLVCDLNHTFDLSKKGYVNLLTSSNNPVYSKELFEARRNICKLGFYEPLVDRLADIINKHREGVAGNRALTILDAGCGEGSHIDMLCDKIGQDKSYNFIGLDISKEAINIAASTNNDIIWLVGDLTKLPVFDMSIDVLLNILTPANYQEFERVLSDDGLIIKVVPGKDYLKELRETIFKENEYSNERVVENFSGKLKVISSQRVYYEFPLNEDDLSNLVKMTPLTWGKDAESELLSKKIYINSITIDLTILVGRKID